MTYQKQESTWLKKLVDQFYPEAFEDRKKFLQERRANFNLGSESVKASLTAGAVVLFQREITTGDLYFDIQLPLMNHVLRFTVSHVKACCGMSFLHSFLVAPKEWLKPEELKLLMNGIIKFSQNHHHMPGSSRLMVNMVEQTQSRRTRDIFASVGPPEEDPVILYRPLWDYFHQNATKVNTMYMPNHNTGNIIHHMEVLFDDSFFEE